MMGPEHLDVLEAHTHDVMIWVEVPDTGIQGDLSYWETITVEHYPRSVAHHRRLHRKLRGSQ